MPLKEEKILRMEKGSVELRNEFLNAAKEGPDRLERLSEFLELLEIVDSDPEIKVRLMNRIKKYGQTLFLFFLLKDPLTFLTSIKR